MKTSGNVFEGKYVYRFALLAAVALGLAAFFMSTPMAHASVVNVVINEFVSNGSSDQIELYNTTGASVDLTGWVLKDLAGNAFSLPTSIAANGFVSVSVSNKLNDAGDVIYLLNASSATTSSVGYGDAATTSVDYFEYAPTPGAGESAYRAPDGGSTWYVGTPTIGSANAGPTSVTVPGDYATIQDAVNAVASGGTIAVTSGTTTESVTISKPLTLQGSNGAGLIGQITIAADNVTVSGMTITNPSAGYGITATDHSDLSITGNTLYDIGSALSSGSAQAIYVKSGAAAVSDISISGNHISNVGNTGLSSYSSSGSAKGIFIGDSDGSNNFTTVTISNNVIDGVYADGADAYPTGRGAYGIEVNHSTGAASTNGLTIAGNTISNLDGLWAHGIGLEGNTPNASLTGNVITNLTDHKSGTDAVGIRFEDNASASTVTIGSGNTLNGKTLSNSAASVFVDASLTPYMSSTGAEYCPTTGTACYYIGMNAFDTIQGGLNAVASGGTVTVAAGSYSENPTISTPATLIAAVYDGTATSTITGELTVDAANTTVTGFEVTNPSVGYGILINGKDGVVITHNYVHDIGSTLTAGSAQGIYLVGGSGAAITSATISDNTIDSIGNADLAYGSSGSAKGIYIGDTSGSGSIGGLTIDSNTISNVAASTTPWTSSPVTKYGRGAYGIQVNFGGTTSGTISNNTISSLSGLWAHAIGLEGNTPAMTLTNNIISNLSDNKGGTDEVALQLEDNAGGSAVTGSGNTYNGMSMVLGTSAIYVDPSATGNSSTRFPEVLLNGAYYYAGMNAFPTIAAGAAAAAPNGTVNVLAGTYANEQLTGSYNSNITVQGAATSTTFVDGLDLSGSSFNGLTFKDLTFKGDSAGYGDFSVTIGADGSYSGLTFKNDAFDGASTDGRGAIFLNRGFVGFTLQDNTFANYVSATPGTVYSIVFAEAQGGAAGDTFLASGNTLTNANATNFLEAYRWQNPTFQNNNVNADLGRLLVWSTDAQSLGTVTLSNNTIAVGGGKGLQVYDAPSSSVNVTGNTVTGADTCASIDSVDTTSITNNTLTGCTTGILFAQSEATVPTSATVSGNVFDSGATGLSNTTSLVVDASGNWWGDALGPTASDNSNTTTGGSVSTSVTYRPWCIDAACTSVPTTAPTLSSATVSPTDAKDGTVVTVTLTFDRSMNTALPPTVGLTGIEAGTTTVTQTSYSGDTWVGTATVATSTHSEFTANVAVYGGEDPYGNQFAGDPSATTLSVDTLAPAITAIDVAQVTSGGTAAGWLKIGDQILFTVNTAKAESGASVSGSYEGHALSWVAQPGNTQFVGTYTVTSGDAYQPSAAPLQITGVTVTDAAGNTSYAANSTAVTKGIDASLPIVTLPSTIYATTTATTTGATASDTGSGIATYSWSSSDTAHVSFSNDAVLDPSITATDDGTYTLALQVTDAAGNSETEVTTLHRDTTPPKIGTNADIPNVEATGSTGAAVTFSLPSTTDSSGIASETCTPASGSTFALGTTTVTCTATDKAGNSASSTFDVGVVDTTAPTISLTLVNGTTTVYMAKGNTYVEPGASASDVVDGTDTVTTSGTLDTSTAGTYTLFYDASDAAGNAATQVSRTVEVDDSAFTLATSTSHGDVVGTIGTEATSSASTGGITVTFDIPAGTTVTGTSTWDGVVNFPTVSSSYTGPTAPDGFTDSVTSAIEMGSSGTELTFDKGVRILFSGAAGQHVGWSVSGSGTFTEITSTCSADSQAVGDALASGGDCKIDVGGDLVVWTKHFTTFLTFTQTANPTTSSGGGNGPVSGGGGGGGVVAVALPNNGGAAPGSVSAGTGSTGGQVLGASTFNFQHDMTLGSSLSPDVSELQKVLIAEGFDIPAITVHGAAYGYFGAETKSAVMKYQAAHGVSPTSGYVGPLTRAQLNKGTTPTASDEQRQALIAQLQAQLQTLLGKIAELKNASSTVQQ